MAQTIVCASDYEVAPSLVWESAISFDDLAHVIAPLARFRGLPSGAIAADTGRIEIEVSVFGIAPWRPYAMELVSFDPENHRLESAEFGLGLRQWSHVIEVTKVPGGARLTDRVTIDAGIFTWAFVAYAKFMYRHRIPRRRALLRKRALAA